jgi:hypothetical protein
MIDFKKILLIGTLLVNSLSSSYGMNSTNNLDDEFSFNQKRTAIIQIGINYTGTQNQLNGCGNDIENLFNQRFQKKFDSGIFNYKNTEMYVLTDFGSYIKNINKNLQNIINTYKMSNQDKNEILSSKFINLDNNSKIPNRNHLTFGLPTKSNIEKVLENVMGKKDIDYVVIQYSGHGGQVKTTNDIYEDDGCNEALIPLDFYNNGVIEDDYINATMTNNLPHSNIKGIFALMDCCHSGTAIDLSHKGILNNNIVSCLHERENEILKKYCILALSGCKDSQTSADAFLDNSYQGALTNNFLKVAQKLENQCSWTPEDILNPLYDGMKTFEQKPVITSSFCFNKNCTDPKCKTSCQEPKIITQSRINQSLFSIFGRV